MILDEPSDELQCDPFDFTFHSFCKIYRYQEQGVIRPFMEMIDAELEPVTDKFQIYMMRYLRGEKRCVSKFGRSENI